ncbi:MAG: hypothetical protein ACTSXL_05775 [Alphaproteobacteria bacterium]|nr:MAG: hypothetical protein B6I23_02555 [Rickettsiaceae bacterium 4572_127]
MKKIILLLLCVFSVSVFAKAGSKDLRDMKARRGQREKKESNYARMNPPASAVVDPATIIAKKESSPCPIDKIKTQLTAYCATVVCSDSASIISAIQLGGTNLDKIDGDCQALVWQAIATRLENTFSTFKTECDRMNTEYAGAIGQWKKKYDEMVKSKDKAKKQRNIAVGVGSATTLGGTIGGFLLGKNQNAPAKTGTK